MPQLELSAEVRETLNQGEVLHRSCKCHLFAVVVAVVAVIVAVVVAVVVAILAEHHSCKQLLRWLLLLLLLFLQQGAFFQFSSVPV